MEELESSELSSDGIPDLIMEKRRQKRYLYD